MSNKKLCFGLKKSKVEPIDHVVGTTYINIDMPKKSNLKDRVKKVYDQKNLNACSSNAAASLLSLSNTDIYISRLYLYFCSRWLDNNMNLPIQDVGTTLKSVFNALSQHHYIVEDKYPYYEHMVNEVPYKHIFEEAFTNKQLIVSYRQILPSKYAIKYILYKLQQPVIFGMSVYTNFLKITK